jgi:hypothetical protein
VGQESKRRSTGRRPWPIDCGRTGAGLESPALVGSVVAVAQVVRALDCGTGDAMREHEAMLPHRVLMTRVCAIVSNRPANNGKQIPPVSRAQPA